MILRRLACREGGKPSRLGWLMGLGLPPTLPAGGTPAPRAPASVHSQRGGSPLGACTTGPKPNVTASP